MNWIMIAYLVLERLALQAESSQSPEQGGHIRDAMGKLWEVLSNSEREKLWERVGTPQERNGLDLRLRPGLRRESYRTMFEIKGPAE
jgi:hypothetical protein